MTKHAFTVLLICAIHFANSISIDSAFNREEYVCRDTDCSGGNQRCIPKGADYFCECEAGFKLVDERIRWTKDIRCIDEHECKDPECTGGNQMCIPNGADYFCVCNDGFKLVDEDRKGTKDIKCIDEHECKDSECTGGNQTCIPNGADYFCVCNVGYKLLDGDKMGTKDIKCIDEYECEGIECTAENQICISRGGDYYCECKKGFKLVDEGKKGTKDIQCIATCMEDDQCKNGALCAKEGDHSFCKCLKGTSGNFCEKVDECTPENEKCGENSGAICKYNKNVEKAECVCEVNILEYDASVKLCRVTCNDEDRCKNGAICMEDGTYGFCKCLKGTSGNLCEKVDECIPENEKCGEDSGAICKYNEDLQKAECECGEPSLKYDASMKLCRVPCTDEEKCKNGATCTGEGTHSFCKCLNRTSGNLCEKFDECIPEHEKCGENSGAICKYNKELKVAECVCESTTLEYDASVKLCRETCDENIDCKNGGRCKTIGHYSFCECMPGTTGPKCEAVTECKDGSLVCNPGSGANCGFNIDEKRAECLCNDELKYDTENKTCKETCYAHNVCKNGGTCVKIGHYAFCECMPGTTGSKCDAVTDCMDGSIVCNPRSGAICGFNIHEKRAECLCHEGLKYDTSNKTCRGTCGLNNVCHNGGSCKKIGHYSFCECVSGTNGHKCEVVTECEDGRLVCEAISGSYCGFNIHEKRAECLCHDGLKYDMETKTCRDLTHTTKEDFSTKAEYFTSTPGELSTRFKYITSTPGELSTATKLICDEDENDCLNGGACFQIGNQRFCHCLRGTYGEKCQHMFDCDEKYDLKCSYKKGEVCAYNTTLGESECLCLESELQYDIEREMCRKICLVGNYDCKNGAICKTVGSYAFCECHPGTSGHECEIVEGCNFINCNTSTGARCEYNIHLETAECVCDNDMKYDEDTSLCRETCRNSTDCLNEAYCSDRNDGFCRCMPGTHGLKCEIVEDCENRKVICNENRGEKCGFIKGEAGCLCENNLQYDKESLMCREPCNQRRDECKNGAHCNFIGFDYFCECPPGTSGHRCEIVESKREYSPLLLLILLCVTSGFLLVSTITLVSVFIKFRSRRNKKPMERF